MGETQLHRLVALRLVASGLPGFLRCPCPALQELHAAFNTTMGSLYVNLQSKTLQQYDKAPYLRQLHLRLDFNGYIKRQNKRFLDVQRTVTTSYRQQRQQQEQEEREQGRRAKAQQGRQQGQQAAV